MLFRKRDNRLVQWASLNQWIPLRCNKCGAIFITKNVGPLGSRPIHYGLDYDRCKLCEQNKHKLQQLIPAKDIFDKGVW